MVLQNRHAMSEKSPKWSFCPLISFRGTYPYVNVKGCFLLPTNLRFEEIGVETAESFGEK